MFDKRQVPNETPTSKRTHFQAYRPVFTHIFIQISNVMNNVYYFLQKCIPEFGNAAFDVVMESTNTCGDEGPVDYCVQTGASSLKQSCDVCLPHQHDGRFLTDLHSLELESHTWWQSETMFEGIQFPSQVNLTLNLRKYPLNQIHQS